MVYKLTNEPENYAIKLQYYYKANKGTGKTGIQLNQEFKQKIENKQEKDMQRQLIAVDKMIKNLNFKVSFMLEEFRLDGLNDIDNRNKYKRHLFQIKTDPTEIRIFKQGLYSGISGFGITFTTKNSFEMLCQFAFQLKKSIGVYTDNPAIKKVMIDLSESSFPSQSKIIYTSPKRQEKDILEDSDLEESKIKEDKFRGGPKLFQRDYENDDTLGDISDIAPASDRKVKPILKSPYVYEETKSPSPARASSKKNPMKTSQQRSRKKRFKKKNKFIINE